MNWKVRFFIACLFFTVENSKADVVVTQVPVAVEENDDLQLLCTVPIADLSTTITFFKGGVSNGGCSSPIPGIAPGICDSNIEQNIHTGITTYNISSATVADIGPWECRLGLQSSDELSLTVVFRGAIVNNQWNLPAEINNVNELLSVEIDCCYPQPTVQWKVKICAQTDLTNVATNPSVIVNGSVSCTSPKKAYSSSITVVDIAKPSTQTCYEPRVEVKYASNLPTDSQLFTSRVIIQGTPTSSSSSHGKYCIIYIIIVIIFIVMISVLIIYCCSNKNSKTYETCWCCKRACYSDYPVSEKKSTEEWYINCYCKSKQSCQCKILSRKSCFIVMCCGLCLKNLPPPTVRSIENEKQLNDTPKKRKKKDKKSKHLMTENTNQSDDNTLPERKKSMDNIFSTETKDNKVHPDPDGKINNAKLNPIDGNLNNMETKETLIPRQLPLPQ